MITSLLTSSEDHYQNVVIYLLKQQQQQQQQQKIVNLTKCKTKSCNTNYYVPIINLSNYNLQKLNLGFDYCFADKNKDVQRFLAANIGSLAYNIKGNISDKNTEHFHEFLHSQ